MHGQNHINSYAVELKSEIVLLLTPGFCQMSLSSFQPATKETPFS